MFYSNFELFFEIKRTYWTLEAIFFINGMPKKNFSLKFQLWAKMIAAWKTCSYFPAKFVDSCWFVQANSVRYSFLFSDAEISHIRLSTRCIGPKLNCNIISMLKFSALREPFWPCCDIIEPTVLQIASDVKQIITVSQSLWKSMKSWPTLLTQFS